MPPNARLLDIGAGHGVFSVLAADRGARVVAVEPDVRKAPFGGCRVAGLPGSRGSLTTWQPGNHYVVGYDDVVRGQFDTIAINDVLYKLPLAQWDPLVTRAKERLTTGGTLIIKEHDPTSRWKNAWNRAQEAIATKLRLTLGESFTYETPDEFTARLQRLGFRDVEARRIDFGYPHAHIVYVGRRE